MTKQKLKDTLRSILFLCGYGLKSRNEICAVCLTTQHNDRFKKCRDEFSRIDALIQFYCTMNYYQCKGENPPEDVAQCFKIIEFLTKYIKEKGKFPDIVYSLPAVLQIHRGGSITIEETCAQYRITLLSHLYKNR